MSNNNHNFSNFQIAHEFVLEINIGFLGKQIQYGGSMDDC